MLDRLVQANDWTCRRPCSIYSPAVVNLATISEGRYIAVSILSRPSLVFEICIFLIGNEGKAATLQYMPAEKSELSRRPSTTLQPAVNPVLDLDWELVCLRVGVVCSFTPLTLLRCCLQLETPK